MKDNGGEDCLMEMGNIERIMGITFWANSKTA
jgi:hypothetical protein